MMFNACPSVRDYLLRELYRRGKIVSVTAFANCHGLERCHVWQQARLLEREGKVMITRQHANGPLTLERVENYRPPVESGLVYQLSFL